MKVVITGGAGFIGRNLIEGYLQNGYEVVVIDNISTGKEENLQTGVKLYKMDITDEAVIDVIINEKPDVINHHAAQIDVHTSVLNPYQDAKINILGTINILEAARKLPDVKLVYASSAAVYGNPEYLGVDEEHPVKPLSGYGISKHTPEHYIQSFHYLYGLNYTVLRYANVFGIGQDPKGEGGVVCILVDKVTNNETFNLFGDGEQTRDFIYVEDVVKANLAASQNSIQNIVNIGTGKATSLNELVSIFQKVVGKEINVEYKEEREGDIKHSYLLNSKAMELLSWSPDYSLEEGLEKTFNYYNKNVE